MWWYKGLCWFCQVCKNGGKLWRVLRARVKLECHRVRNEEKKNLYRTNKLFNAVLDYISMKNWTEWVYILFSMKVIRITKWAYCSECHPEFYSDNLPYTLIFSLSSPNYVHFCARRDWIFPGSSSFSFFLLPFYTPFIYFSLAWCERQAGTRSGNRPGRSGAFCEWQRRMSLCQGQSDLYFRRCLFFICKWLKHRHSFLDKWTASRIAFILSQDKR